MRALGVAASPRGSRQRGSPSNGAQGCEEHSSTPTFYFPPLSLPHFPFKFSWILISQLRPSRVFDHLPSLAQRGFSRPSIVQTPVGGGLWGPLSSVAPRSSEHDGVAPSGLAPPPPHLARRITRLKDHRAGGPPRWRAPQAGDASVPGAAGVATLHQRPFKSIADHAGASHAVIDDCGCGSGGARAGRAWHQKRMKNKKVREGTFSHEAPSNMQCTHEL